MSKKNKHTKQAADSFVHSNPDRPNLEDTPICEYLEIVKSQYEIERNKKLSFENRSGLLLTLLGVICVFLFNNIKLAEIISMLNIPLTFINLIKITSGISVYITFFFTLFAIMKTIIAKKHPNFELKNITIESFKENRVDALANIILSYIEIILGHRDLNENRSKWYIRSLYSVLFLLISTIFYTSI